MDRLFLCGGRILESSRSRHFWFHDQSANRSLLHAGVEYNGSTRARRALRCLRHVGSGPNAVLLASDESYGHLEKTTNLARVLGHQYWTDARNRAELIAGGLAANLSVRSGWILVGTQSNRTTHGSPRRIALMLVLFYPLGILLSWLFGEATERGKSLLIAVTLHAWFDIVLTFPNTRTFIVLALSVIFWVFLLARWNKYQMDG